MRLHRYKKKEWLSWIQKGVITAVFEFKVIEFRERLPSEFFRLPLWLTLYAQDSATGDTSSVVEGLAEIFPRILLEHLVDLESSNAVIVAHAEVARWFDDVSIVVPVYYRRFEMEREKKNREITLFIMLFSLFIRACNAFFT